MKRLLFSYLTLWFFVTFGCDPLQSPKELINSGKLRDAAVLLEKIVQAKPENVEARILLGETYDQSGQYNQSVNQFREAILILPAQPKDQAILRIRLAKLYLKNSDRRKAFSQLRLTLQSTSDQDIISQVAGLVTDRYQIIQLTKGDSDNYSPNFSPDGKQIAFSSYRSDNSEVYIMDLDGRIRQRVTFTTDFNESAPVFLHDNKYILYIREPKTSRQITITLQGSGSSRIYAGLNISHIFSKKVQELLPIGHGVRAPSVSPDRKRILYETKSGNNLELYEIDLTNVDLDNISPKTIPARQITKNAADDGNPAFYPDQKKIVFSSSRQEQPHQIYTTDINGANETHLNSNPYDCYSPIVSPDGKQIVFVSARHGDIEIFSMNVDGTNDHQVTNGIGASIQPAFSPDGSKIAFVSDRSDSFQVYLMHLDQPIGKLELLQYLASQQ
mgnify:CR=1 FL=1